MINMAWLKAQHLQFIHVSNLSLQILSGITCVSLIIIHYINMINLNPYLTNGFSHYYQLGECTFIFRGIRSDFQFLNNFLMKILLANRIAPDGTPRSAASHLGLFCLPMSHKRDARLK